MSSTRIYSTSNRHLFHQFTWLHVPSSPSSMFGGGISITFFKTTGNEVWAPVAVSSVMRIFSPDIFFPCCLRYPSSNWQKRKQRSCPVCPIMLAIQSVSPPFSNVLKIHDNTSTHSCSLRCPLPRRIRSSGRFWRIEQSAPPRQKCMHVLIGGSWSVYMNINYNVKGGGDSSNESIAVVTSQLAEISLVDRVIYVAQNTSVR